MRALRGFLLSLSSMLLLIWALYACETTRAQDLALVGAKIYPSPAGVAVEGGTVLVHDGRIAAVGPSATIKIPKEATVLNCQGMVVTAGFWNSRVHIVDQHGRSGSRVLCRGGRTNSVWHPRGLHQPVRLYRRVHSDVACRHGLSANPCFSDDQSGRPLRLCGS